MNAGSGGVTQLGRPGAAAGAEFLMRTLELAQIVLRAASDSRNPEHVTFCRRAARDFLGSVTRLLPHMKTAGQGQAAILAATEQLEYALRNLDPDANP